MSKPITPPSRRRRYSLTVRSLIASTSFAAVSLALLVVHVFVPAAGLQTAAVWVLGGGFLSAWIAVLAWRMPVFGQRMLIFFAMLWALGVALSVLCVRWSLTAGTLSELFRRSSQWLALSISFAVGALFLRALLRRRTTPIVARLLSLLSPLAILLLILLSSPGR